MKECRQWSWQRQGNKLRSTYIHVRVLSHRGRSVGFPRFLNQLVNELYIFQFDVAQGGVWPAKKSQSPNFGVCLLWWTRVCASVSLGIRFEKQEASAFPVQQSSNEICHETPPKPNGSKLAEFQCHTSGSGFSKQNTSRPVLKMCNISFIFLIPRIMAFSNTEFDDVWKLQIWQNDLHSK